MVNLGDLVYRIVCKDEASAGVNAAAANISRAGLAIGTGMTAAGAAMVALTDGNRKMDASFKTTALSMGVSVESVKELGRSLQSVDSPITEVAATLDILARAGMDNVDSMGQTASAFDTLADGIGVSADALTDAMVPAFNALNIELEDAPQYVDGLATMFRTANVDLGDFSQLMSRVGPDLGKMGLGLQDVETILMALADKGITGRKAMSTLSAAIKEADGDTAKLYASIGITNTELGTYSQKLADSAGSAQKFADAQNEQFGVIDKLGFEFAKLAQTAGDWLKPFEGVGTALTIIGPALAGAAGAMEIYSAAQGLLAGTSLTAGGALAGFGTSLGIVAAEAPIVATEMAELGVSSAGAGLAMMEAGAGANVMAEGLPAAELTAAAGGGEFIGLSAGSAGAAASLATAGVAADTAAVGLTAAGIGAGEAAVGLGAAEAAAVPLAGAIAALVLPLGLVAGGMLALDAAWKQNGWYKDDSAGIKQAFKDGKIAIDQTTGAVLGNAEALSNVEPVYDDFGNAIGTITREAVPGADALNDLSGGVRGAGSAAGDAIPNFFNMNRELGNTPAIAAAEKMSEVEKAIRGFNGTTADSFATEAAMADVGPSPEQGTMTDEAYAYLFGEWKKRWVAALEKYGAYGAPGTPQPKTPALPTAGGSTGGGSGGTAPTWAGQNDPDYGGGNPGYASGQLDDPRLNGVVASYKAIQTEAPKTADTIKVVTKSIADQTGAADELGPVLTTYTEKVQTTGTTSETTAPKVAGLGQVFYDASGAAYTLQAPLDAANAALFRSGETAQGSVSGITAHQQAVLGM